MNARERIGFLVGLVLVVGLGVYTATHFRVSTEISHFMPAPQDRALADLSRQLAGSELSRTMILAIEADTIGEALDASRRFESRLRSDPRTGTEMAFLEAGPPAGTEQVLFELYSPRNTSFLASTPEAARARIGEDGIREALRALRNELGGALSSLVSRVAPRDPFLTIPTLFESLGRSRANDLVVRDGRFVVQDPPTAILFLGTRHSAFDSRAQSPLLEGIAGLWQEVASESPNELRLDQSGVNRFAVQTERAIEGDIQRISIVSSVLIGAFLLLLFRSLQFLALALIPVATGVLAGMSIVLFVSGELHGVTLAFGASLIGVSIDYVVHLYCHSAIVRPSGGPRASLRSILKPLATGAITTIAGFSALAASSLVGLREVALFSVVGITGAFAATVLFLPALMSERIREAETRRRLITTLDAGLASLGRRRGPLLGVVVACLGLMAVALPNARWNSDISSLTGMDPELAREDARVRAKVAPFEQMRFVVSLGDDEEAALETNDRVDRTLREAISQGELESRRSLAPLLPAPALQMRIDHELRSDADFPARLRRIAAEEGFAATAFDPFLTALESPVPRPLRYADLLESSIAGLVRTFRVSLGDRIGFVTFLNGIEDLAALRSRIDAVPDAVLVQQSELFGTAQLEYQRHTLTLLAWGLLAVLLILALRYRDMRRTCMAFLPAVLAAGVTVSVLTLLGFGLDLISLTALLFVVSMGVDYSVFLVDARDESDRRAVLAALMGALLAGVSTVAAFGLLALSQHPVLASLGLTAAVGIATSLLLAPTALVLIGRESDE